MSHNLITDEGNPVESTPARGIDDDSDGEVRKDWRKIDEKKYTKPPSYPVDESDLTYPHVNDTTANCHGTTFGSGGCFIDNKFIPTILRDNYLKVDIAGGQKARVCDVVVWKGDRHSALVVEIGKDGKPSMVIGKNGSKGRLWAHPPGDFGEDYDVYERRNGFDGATQKEIDDLKEAQMKAKADSDADPKNDEKLKKAHKAAYELCRRKNRLKSKTGGKKRWF